MRTVICHSGDKSQLTDHSIPLGLPKHKWDWEIWYGVAKTATSRVPGPSAHQHAVFPTRVATGELQLQPAEHARLATTIVNRYKSIANADAAVEAYATQMYEGHIDLGPPVIGSMKTIPPGVDEWPELYRSAEYEALVAALEPGARAQAAFISNLPATVVTRAKFTLRPAVQLPVAEQVVRTGADGAILHGYYFASVHSPGSDPNGSGVLVPLELSDPKGGRSGAPDPEAPFIKSTVFFPKVGDVIMFPAWLPHRIGEGGSESPDEPREMPVEKRSGRKRRQLERNENDVEELERQNEPSQHLAIEQRIQPHPQQVVFEFSIGGLGPDVWASSTF
eukprot:SAG31_NODE_52_length_30366_cov_34.368586_2_plen_335_part_00